MIVHRHISKLTLLKFSGLLIELQFEQCETVFGHLDHLHTFLLFPIRKVRFLLFIGLHDALHPLLVCFEHFHHRVDFFVNGYQVSIKGSY